MDIEEYSKYKQFFTDEIPDLLLNELNNTEWKTYLDLGCGDGSLLYALDKKGYFAGKTVFAVDLSENRINLVKKINKDFICFVDNACNIKNIKDNSIDFLVSSQLIEHVSDDEKMIKEIARVLRKNGTAYISTVFKKWYGWYFYRCNGKWTLDPTHVREYTKEGQLFDFLDKYNFEVVKNEKTIVKHPLINFFLKRLGAGRQAYNNSFLRPFKNLKVPVPGYYKWEIICKKK
jgi:2-polyprenyl-3-methyl-5-hydroxy-6-metoxy-1,4-benzoquinol methylase